MSRLFYNLDGSLSPPPVYCNLENNTVTRKKSGTSSGLVPLTTCSSRSQYLANLSSSAPTSSTLWSQNSGNEANGKN